MLDSEVVLHRVRKGRANIWTRALVVCVLAFAAIPAGVFVSRSLEWRREYDEAELLVGLIWNLASCMNDFSAKYGRPPNSIDEVEACAGSYDYSALKRYTHEFTANGSTRFYLRVNRRFAFAVNENFNPQWAQFTGVLQIPQVTK